MRHHGGKPHEERPAGAAAQKIIDGIESLATNCQAFSAVATTECRPIREATLPAAPLPPLAGLQAQAACVSQKSWQRRVLRNVIQYWLP